MGVSYECWLPNPVPRFVLFAHDHGEIIRTTSLDAFRQEVSRIPAGKTLRCFNTCAAGTHSGLDPSILEEIEAFCQQRAILFLGGDEEIICVCP